jgi:hypothetical protein
MAKAVDGDLNIAPDSYLARHCKEARVLAIQVLGDHVVQELVTTGVKVDTCTICCFAPAPYRRIDGQPVCEECYDECAAGA